jgi:lysophospholipase L1-like esterase
MKIVCIGDSNVNGFPYRQSQCWVSLFQKQTGHTVINQGMNGNTSRDVLERFDADVLAHKPDAAVILAGANDFFWPECAPATVLGHCVRMVRLCARHGVKPVLLIPSLTDPAMAAVHWIGGVDYEQINRQLADLRALMLEYGDAGKDRVKVVDLQAIYTKGFVDGVHWTLEGHAQVADFLAGQRRSVFGGVEDADKGGAGDAADCAG